MVYKPQYNKKAVDEGIERAGLKKNGKEAKLIHALLKGRRKNDT